MHDFNSSLVCSIVADLMQFVYLKSRGSVFHVVMEVIIVSD